MTITALKRRAILESSLRDDMATKTPTNGIGRFDLIDFVCGYKNYFRNKGIMRRPSMLILFGLCSIASRAQGTIDFMNRNIPGANGGPSYNVPIWVNGSTTVGAGTLPGGVAVGLFEAGATTPLVTTLLRTDTPGNAAFFATFSQTATTTQAAGTTPQLFVRAWQTSFGSFLAAKLGPGASWGEWSFTAQPLGGTPPGGGLPIPTPGMTGWGPGPDAGGGYELTNVIIPEPSTVALGLLGVGVLFLRRKNV